PFLLRVVDRERRLQMSGITPQVASGHQSVHGGCPVVAQEFELPVIVICANIDQLENDAAGLAGNTRNGRLVLIAGLALEGDCYAPLKYLKAVRKRSVVLDLVVAELVDRPHHVLAVERWFRGRGL